jgi:hypothetical protein
MLHVQCEQTSWPNELAASSAHAREQHRKSARVVKRPTLVVGLVAVTRQECEGSRPTLLVGLFTTPLVGLLHTTLMNKRVSLFTTLWSNELAGFSSPRKDRPRVLFVYPADMRAEAAESRWGGRLLLALLLVRLFVSRALSFVGLFASREVPIDPLFARRCTQKHTHAYAYIPEPIYMCSLV